MLNFIERYQANDYETICLENNEMEEIVDKIQVEYNNLLKENEYMHKQLDKQQTTINKYAKENEQLKNAVAVANKLEERIKEKFISKSKIEEKIAKLEGSCVVMDDWVCCALKDLLKESEE